MPSRGRSAGGCGGSRRPPSGSSGHCAGTRERGRHRGVKTIIHGIGQIASGDIAAPLLDANTIVCADGRITWVGQSAGVDDDTGATLIDARGSTVIPGLIDSHVHPVFGDFTPRQRTVDFLDSELNGGVTTMISAGEVHLPGRPKDVVGLKALAIVAARAYQAFRPSGAKVHAGAPILELGLTEADFAEMAQAGVRLVGEIGLGSVRTGREAAPMVRWAKQHGMTVTIHTGGPSIAGSSPIDADTVLEADPHVVGHINGGTTSLGPREIETLVTRTGMALEIVHCGNPRMALHALRLAGEAGAWDRIILGNDAPSGTGVVPLGILRTLALLASVGDCPPEIAVAMATGNTASVYGLPVGTITPGREADLVICDAPIGSVASTAMEALRAGDLPGISMVLIDGVPRVGRSRNTAPAARAADVTRGHAPGGGH